MSLHSVRNLTLSATLSALALALGVAAIASQPNDAKSGPKDGKTQSLSMKMTLDPMAIADGNPSKIALPYYPVVITLSAEKPAEVKVEPQYVGTPKYGVVHLGNGPKSAFVVAIDEAANGDCKIYLDKNRNGDLTDDGDGAWTNRTPATGTAAMYGINNYVLRASWGTATRETSSGDYGVGLYYLAARHILAMKRIGARVGTVTIAGKAHKAMLVENDNDAIYSRPVPTDDKGVPTGKVSPRPVWLFVDIADTGSVVGKGDVRVDVRAPFELAGTVYEADITADGSKMKMSPTTKVAAQLTPKPVPPPALLASGVTAPVFTAEALDGHTLSLADFKGKIVVLDFWATWCPPCQRSMPHIQKVFEATKDKDVVVLGVCVWDAKAAYDAWMPINKSKYGFTFAFDPAAKDNANSIAVKSYHVSAIPTTYIIDRDGNVAASIVGYSDGDKRVEEALKKVGVDITSAGAL